LIACLAALLALQPAALAAPAAAPGIDLPIRSEQGGLVRGRVPLGSRVSLGGDEVPVAPDGQVLLGFDRDHGEAATILVTLPGGRRYEQRVAVAPRAWQIEHVNVARRPGGPTQEFLRIREGELARIVAARSQRSDTQGWRQSFAWPSRGRISGRFGSQRVYRGEPASFHSGVDVAAGAGAPVVAPADGVVVLASPPAFSLEGNLVIIDHGMGLNSAFLHLSDVNVSVGQRVTQGERIGSVGATGRATGPHLHWALTLRGVRLDPERVAAISQ
jgi:hypothetical protein